MATTPSPLRPLSSGIPLEEAEFRPAGNTVMMVGALLITLFLATMSYGCNECDFEARCHNNRPQYCGEGPDHLFGRKIRSYTCPEEAPICVEVDHRLVYCRTDPLSPCDDSFESHCLGNVVMRCQSDMVVGVDCDQSSNPSKPDAHYVCGPGWNDDLSCIESVTPGEEVIETDASVYP